MLSTELITLIGHSKELTFRALALRQNDGTLDETLRYAIVCAALKDINTFYIEIKVRSPAPRKVFTFLHSFASLKIFTLLKN